MLSTRGLARGARVSRTSSSMPSTSFSPRASSRRAPGRAPSSHRARPFSPRDLPPLSRVGPSASGLSTRTSSISARACPTCPVSRLDLAELSGRYGAPHAAGSLLRPTGGSGRAAGRDRPLHRRVSGGALPPRADPRHGGTTQAVGIVSRLLLRGGRTPCILEDPVTAGHPAHQRAASGEDHTRARGRAGYGRGCAACRAGIRHSSMSPPLISSPGGTMPIQRRARLLALCSSPGAFVVEDDYDSEFRYDSPPSAPSRVWTAAGGVHRHIQQDPVPVAAHRVHRLPPRAGRTAGREVKWFTDLHNSSVEQLVLARFIAGGHYLRHLHAMKKSHRALRGSPRGCARKNFHGYRCRGAREPRRAPPVRPLPRRSIPAELLAESRRQAWQGVPRRGARDPQGTMGRHDDPRLRDVESGDHR